MKKVVLTLLCLLTAAVGFSQKVYQSGAYWGQSLRPGYITIKGILIDKYINKGFYWYTVVDQNTTYKISVMSTNKWDSAKVDSLIIVPECFELSSNKWKRKTKH